MRCTSRPESRIRVAAMLGITARELDVRVARADSRPGRSVWLLASFPVPWRRGRRTGTNRKRSTA